MVITIVGSGAAALAFLYNYIQLTTASSINPTTIYLVEKRGVFGPGAAYSADSLSNILNTKTGYITPFHDRPGDFFNWLNSNQRDWRRRFPDLVVDAESYVSRPLFGMYLQCRMNEIIKTGLLKNIRIIQIHAEVKNVVPGKAGGHVINTVCNLSLESDYVFLFCGTLTAKSKKYPMQTDRMLNTPYPISDLRHKIPCHASVGISGARLGCIDAVIGMIENGHKGKISIHSRSGYFPSVRGTQGRIVPKILTSSNINSIIGQKGKLNLTDVLQLIQSEIALLTGKQPFPDFTFPAPPRDLSAYLSKELELSQHPRHWQAVLYSTNSIIDKLWMALDDDCKDVFFKKYMSAYICHRVSIPVENARKFLAHLESGQISFHQGEYEICMDDDGLPVFSSKSGADWNQRRYDYAIEAIGSPRAVCQLDSDLISNMLERGALKANKFGGIMVNTETYQVINANDDADSSIFAVGEITSGTFFFTSALDINARHARNCAIQFIKIATDKEKKSTEEKVKTQQGGSSFFEYV
jgi:uncharacterized NAD(P)/FAD-binding protein YdhS